MHRFFQPVSSLIVTCMVAIGLSAILPLISSHSHNERQSEVSETTGGMMDR